MVWQEDKIPLYKRVCAPIYTLREVSCGNVIGLQLLHSGERNASTAYFMLECYGQMMMCVMLCDLNAIMTYKYNCGTCCMIAETGEGQPKTARRATG